MSTEVIDTVNGPYVNSEYRPHLKDLGEKQPYACGPIIKKHPHLINEIKDLGEKQPFVSTYEKIGQEIGQLVFEKQMAYGDSFGNAGAVLKILYPLGIRVDQYDDALAVVRIIDKLFRIANEKDAFGENPYKDIAGYGILGSAKGKAEG